MSALKKRTVKEWIGLIPYDNLKKRAFLMLNGWNLVLNLPVSSISIAIFAVNTRSLGKEENEFWENIEKMFKRYEEQCQKTKK